MQFDELAVIPTPHIFREAKVSPTRGNRVLSKLRDAGRVSTTRTPTGREYVSARDGAVLYSALTEQG